MGVLGRVRAADETLRDASKAIKDKSGGVVEWQLVWDLMRAGRPETAREPRATVLGVARAAIATIGRRKK